MGKTVKTVAFGHLGLPLVILYFVAFTSMLFAGGKEHPLQGTVTALGTSQEGRLCLRTFIEPTP